MAGSKPGERRGGRQKGSLNKATIERQQAAASALAEAQAAILSGIDLSDVQSITGLQVMRLAMIAHVKAGNLDKAAVWGKEIAPFETAKKVAKPEDPAPGNDVPQGFVDGPPIAGSMDEWAQRAKTRTPPSSPQDSPTTSQAEAPGSSETPSESG